MPAEFSIRDANLPQERPQLAHFIDALQHFERAFEPDRRIDETVGEEYFDVLMGCMKAGEGRALVADAGNAGLLGWAVVFEEQARVFVVEEERRYGLISELFVVDSARGKGVGRALIDACEDWARTRGLPVMIIGAHAANARAARIYTGAGFAPYSMQLRKYL
jgi:GNAT superfamily N-acetyltransferase